MLDKIKLALRYRTTAFDEELKVYIGSCKKDLMLAGVLDTKILETDESIISTVMAYCKWQVNFQNNGEAWGKVYIRLKTALALDERFH